MVNVGLGLKLRAEETPTCKEVLQYPSPFWLSQQAWGRLESLFILTASPFLSFSCLYPNLPFWRGSICMVFMRRKTATYCHLAWMPRRPQPSAAFTGRPWARLSQVKFHSPNSGSWACAERVGCLGVTLVTAVRCCAEQPVSIRDLRWGSSVYRLVLRRLLLLPILQVCSSASHWFLWTLNVILTNLLFVSNRAGFCCLQPRRLNGTGCG